MGQEMSSVSILEPLAGGIEETKNEEIEIDQDHLIRAILALTETDTPVHSPKRPEDDLEQLRAEAERDFAEWKKAKRLLRRNTSLSRHDSTASTVSSPMQALAYRHTYDFSPR